MMTALCSTNGSLPATECRLLFTTEYLPDHRGGKVVSCRDRRSGRAPPRPVVGLGIEFKLRAGVQGSGTGIGTVLGSGILVGYLGSGLAGFRARLGPGKREGRLRALEGQPVRSRAVLACG